METILIKNGRVHDGLGNVTDNTDIVIENGKIREIGNDLNPYGARIYDASCKEVMPGFIDPLNVWGVMGPGWTDHDKDETSSPVNPDLNIVYGFDHDGMNFQKVYSFGVTAAGISPSMANVISGRAAVFKTYGRSPYKMLVKEDVAMIASVTNAVKKTFTPRNQTPMTRMGIVSLLTEALEKARKKDDKAPYDGKSDALKKVLSGEQPLFINCSTRAHMDAIELALKPYKDIRLVFVGAYGIDMHRESVESGRAGVILGDLSDAFSSPARTMDYNAAVQLMDQEADIAIGACGDSFASGKESLLWNGILWYKYGLESEKVLRAMTYTPAKLLGVNDRIGSLAPGMDGDIVIWSANPIETYTAKSEAVFISGEEILGKEGYVSCW